MLNIHKLFMFGLAGTGKDVLAELMHEKFNIHSLALADPIRAEYVKFLGRDDYRQNRPKMIEIGEMYKQIYGQDVWCRRAMANIQEFSVLRTHLGRLPNGYLIRDGRYQHEYGYFVEKHGFTPIRLVADDSIRLERLQRRDGDVQLDALKYESEHFIRPEAFAHVIENNGTVDELYEQVKTLLQTLEAFK